MKLYRALYRYARIAYDIDVLPHQKRLQRRVRNTLKARLLGRMGSGAGCGHERRRRGLEARQLIVYLGTQRDRSGGACLVPGLNAVLYVRSRVLHLPEVSRAAAHGDFASEGRGGEGSTGSAVAYR
jgi:hypothetical protein